MGKFDQFCPGGFGGTYNGTGKFMRAWKGLGLVKSKENDCRYHINYAGSVQCTTHVGKDVARICWCIPSTPSPTPTLTTSPTEEGDPETEVGLEDFGETGNASEPIDVSEEYDLA